eukprot:5714746-Alexandrium_andersonii.AAC.1
MTTNPRPVQRRAPPPTRAPRPVAQHPHCSSRREAGGQEGRGDGPVGGSERGTSCGWGGGEGRGTTWHRHEATRNE